MTPTTAQTGTDALYRRLATIPAGTEVKVQNTNPHPVRLSLVAPGGPESTEYADDAPEATVPARGSLTLAPQTEELDLLGWSERSGVVLVSEVPGTAANAYTGWGDYTDTVYTEGSPLTLASGATGVLPNNAGFVREQQKPSDVPTFYDAATQRIPGRNGDGLALTAEVKVKPLDMIATTRVRLWLDIGIPGVELYPETVTLGRGQGIEHSVKLNVPSGYTLDTWEANGGQIRYEIENGDVALYDIRFVFTRTHKAR